MVKAKDKARTRRIQKVVAKAANQGNQRMVKGVISAVIQMFKVV